MKTRKIITIALIMLGASMLCGCGYENKDTVLPADVKIGSVLLLVDGWNHQNEVSVINITPDRSRICVRTLPNTWASSATWVSVHGYSEIHILDHPTP
jgi:hypothetical protein